jgi:hypothetical protein
MNEPSEQESDADFTLPGVIDVSPSALDLARAFHDTVKGTGGDWVATFSWSHSISVKMGPNESYQDIGSCLTLGAFKRHEIPAGVIQTIGGLELAVQIPRSVWEKSARRLIDTDETLLFKLALR